MTWTQEEDSQFMLIYSLFMHIKSTLKILFICPLFYKRGVREWPTLPSSFFQISIWSSQEKLIKYQSVF